MLVATASAVTLIPELACFSFGVKPQLVLKVARGGGWGGKANGLLQMVWLN
jgi:hypothetical protein